MALQSTTAIATVTLQESSSTVTFSGIPTTYRDLILVANMKLLSSAEPRLRFNSDSTTSYSMVQLAANGSGTLSNTGTQSFGWITPNSGTSTTNFDLYTAQLLDYSATNKHKTWLSRYNPDAGYVNALSNRWAKTEAINTVQFFTSSSSFAAGSTFSIYGRIA